MNYLGSSQSKHKERKEGHLLSYIFYSHSVISPHYTLYTLHKITLVSPGFERVPYAITLEFVQLHLKLHIAYLKIPYSTPIMTLDPISVKVNSIV